MNHPMPAGAKGTTMTQAIMPCFDKDCGNYDEAYSNHCRALNAGRERNAPIPRPALPG
ncbi:hypothetical protein HMP0721_1455 [Pseudoramibacter alactolyticus ATCC 23263]|uniref:Uncharacterized protein n=1 Tax=Pseudoramibacter alactolyticus ATCC 23263 TaxID=887929 RepID=E6MHH0_9FIRM|nr:hypothetical protein [Pseudoramibacter alactolyticus]EFV01472.1 hypothetical protein HMP0721_1455 [Pseudoramibacter alactolyticus ATCC 23263]